MFTKSDFHGPEYTKTLHQEYEKIRQRRKSFRGKPDAYDRIEIELDRIWEKFYKSQMD